MVGPELLFVVYKWVFLAKRLRAELTLAQRGSVNGLAGPEVVPPSVFHGHNFIEVVNPSEATG